MLPLTLSATVCHFLAPCAPSQRIFFGWRLATKQADFQRAWYICCKHSLLHGAVATQVLGDESERESDEGGGGAGLNDPLREASITSGVRMQTT